MGRYKGAVKLTAIKKMFPYAVAVQVPPLGLGKRLDLLVGWLNASLPREAYGHWSERDGWGERGAVKDFAVWGFLDDRTARDFQAFADAVMGMPTEDVLRSAVPWIAAN